MQRVDGVLPVLGREVVGRPWSCREHLPRVAKARVEEEVGRGADVGLDGGCLRSRVCGRSGRWRPCVGQVGVDVLVVDVVVEVARAHDGDVAPLEALPGHRCEAEELREEACGVGVVGLAARAAPKSLVDVADGLDDGHLPDVLLDEVPLYEEAGDAAAAQLVLGVPGRGREDEGGAVAVAAALVAVAVVAFVAAAGAVARPGA